MFFLSIFGPIITLHLTRQLLIQPNNNNNLVSGLFLFFEYFHDSRLLEAIAISSLLLEFIIVRFVRSRLKKYCFGPFVEADKYD